MHAEPGREVVAAWAELGDPRSIVSTVEVSAMVSTNRVDRLHLSDGAAVVAKTSSYGSYFLFREDHDRLHRLENFLAGTRYKSFLARTLVGRNGRPFTWYDGAKWVAFYEVLEVREKLPRIITDAQVANLGEEMALFHRQCADVAGLIPRTSTSIRSDAVNLFEMVSDPDLGGRNLHLTVEQVDVVRRHAHRFLERLDELGYDDTPRIPVLIDWNLGNFSVDTDPGGRFRLFSRWDYDWFRIEPRVLDMYSLSRVSSQTGDRTAFTYGPHPLLEPRFKTMLAAYHRIFPLTRDEILMIGEAYRFFLLHYVIHEADAFFTPSLATVLRREAVDHHLPACDRLDLSPLLSILG
jgi:Ser/Thr protein kinase RdoA (MazF antagonist)